ncbi:MAG: DUF1801 domain-containing protein [Bacteroidota bacterium]
MHQIDNWIESLPEQLNETALRVRELVFETVHGVEEKYSYKLPFYHYFGMFCYFTYNKKLKALDITFMRGKDLTEIFPQLEMRGRAIGGSIVLYKPTDINRLKLQEVLVTAAAWQREARQLKIPFVKKNTGKR